jgi:hypothetical protein
VPLRLGFPTRRSSWENRAERRPPRARRLLRSGPRRRYRLDQPRGPGFGFRDRARNTFYDWHTHDYHQLIYAVAGTTQIETDRGRYLLPASRAAWIPAAARHRTLIADVEGASLYFAPAAVADPQGRVRILVASPG